MNPAAFCVHASYFRRVAHVLLAATLALPLAVSAGDIDPNPPPGGLKVAQFKGLGSMPVNRGIATSRAHALSANGQVVVGTFRTGSNNLPTHAFRWSNSTGLVALVPDDPTGTIAEGVSSDGSVVAIGRFGYGLRWDEEDGLLELENDGQGYGDYPSGVSGDGSVIVGSFDAGPIAVSWNSSTGQMTNLCPEGVYASAFGASSGGSNLSIVGAAYMEGMPIVACRWTTALGLDYLGDLPGGEEESFAFAVSADGNVIVGRGTSASGSEAFRWTNRGGIMTGLGQPLNGSASEARAISADGAVIAGRAYFHAQFGSSGYRPIVWDSAHGMRWLEPVLDDHGLADELQNWTLTDAVGVATDASYVYFAGNGYYYGRPQAWWARVPKPLK